MAGPDRRAFQRLKLAKPILGTLDRHSALILDIGVSGAFVEHRGRAVPGLNARLAFRWQGQEIAYRCTVTRSEVVREGGEEGVVSQSGVEFESGEPGAEERLHEMMATFVGQLLAAHRSNATLATGEGAALLANVGQARRSRSRGLITYRWDGASWTHERTEDPTQPPDGFTVAAFEDEDELAMLRESYEKADEEGRRLIRLVSELSVRAATT